MVDACPIERGDERCSDDGSIGHALILLQPHDLLADDVSYTNLPRVALDPTPYAIGLMPGSQSIGSLSGTAGIIRATNNGQGAALVGLANSAT